MRVSISGLVASLLLATCAHSEASERADAEHCNSRQIVLAFYNQALIGRDPTAAFERYASTNFVEHKPDVPLGTRTATAAFLKDLITSMPEARWEIVRTIAEGDMVFVHARFRPTKDASDYAIADVFRLQGCLIAEHWDVVARPPESPENPNSRF